jgi:hypothetical protein
LRKSKRHFIFVKLISENKRPGRIAFSLRECATFIDFLCVVLSIKMHLLNFPSLVNFFDYTHTLIGAQRAGGGGTRKSGERERENARVKIRDGRRARRLLRRRVLLAVFLRSQANQSSHTSCRAVRERDFSSGAGCALSLAAAAGARERAAELIENVKSTRAPCTFFVCRSMKVHIILYTDYFPYFLFTSSGGGAFFCALSLSLPLPPARFFATPFSISPRYYSLTQRAAFIHCMYINKACA